MRILAEYCLMLLFRHHHANPVAKIGQMMALMSWIPSLWLKTIWWASADTIVIML